MLSVDTVLLDRLTHKNLFDNQFYKKIQTLLFNSNFLTINYQQ